MCMLPLCASLLPLTGWSLLRCVSASHVYAPSLRQAGGPDAKLGERTRASLELLRLAERRLELVAKGGAASRGGGGGGKGAAAAAAEAAEAGAAVSELAQLAGSRLRAAREMAKAGVAGGKGKGAGASAAPSGKEQEEALVKQATALAAQVRAGGRLSAPSCPSGSCLY
jgi:hypothetical protein